MAIDIDASFYKTGKASIAADATIVTGTGTQWISSTRAGDLFGTHVGDPVRILSVDSNTQLTLAYPWKGPSQTDADYEIQFTPYDTGYYPAVRQLLQLLTSGNVEAFAGLVGSPDMIPMFTGAGTMELVSRASLINGVRFDAYIETYAELSQYDNEAAGFTVFVGDMGDGRSAIIVKKSATAGDWYDPAYLTGPVGPLASINVGTTTTTAPGTNATVVNSGTPTAPVLDFGIPAGKGFYNQGDYSTTVTYNEGDVVQYNGSSWISKTTNTNSAPPSLPVTSNADWQLLAQMGSGGDMYKSTYDPTGQNKDLFSSLVSFDIAQSNTDAEKGQARANIDADILSGFRNPVINGGFDLWQRNTSQTSSGIASADRWNQSHSGSGVTKSAQRGTFPAGQTEVPGMKYYLSTTFSGGAADSGTFVVVSTRLENLAKYSGQKHTLTFYVRGTAGLSISTSIYQLFGTGGTPSPNVDSIGVNKVTGLNTTWRPVSYTIDIPSIDGKTLGTNGDDSLQITFFLSAGTNLNTQSGNLGVQSGSIEIAKVSFVKGDATAEKDPFSPRHLQQELALCQRYFQRVGYQLSGYSSGAGFQCQSLATLPVPMRRTPTAVVNAAGSFSGIVSSVDIVAASSAYIMVVTANGTGLLGVYNREYFFDAEI